MNELIQSCLLLFFEARKNLISLLRSKVEAKSPVRSYKDKLKRKAQWTNARGGRKLGNGQSQVQ